MKQADKDTLSYNFNTKSKAHNLPDSDIFDTHLFVFLFQAYIWKSEQFECKRERGVREREREEKKGNREGEREEKSRACGKKSSVLQFCEETL